MASAASASLLYLTGITLSLFGAAERRRLVGLASVVRARGGIVAFDPNFRNKGWPDPAQARAAFADILPFVDIGLPTYDDEALLHGDASHEDALARWRDAGVREVTLKIGAQECVVQADGRSALVPTCEVRAVDTTGAGDSFNAAYLAARLRGAVPIEAAEAGNRLAGIVACEPGAIIPRDRMPSASIRAHTDEPGKNSMDSIRQP